jgi:membrane protein
MRETAYRLIAQLDEKTSPAAAKTEIPTTTGDQPTPAEEKRLHGKDFASHLRDAVDQVFAYVDRTNFATLGAAGIFFLLVTVIAVISSIEKAMNAIWKAERGRALGRRVMDYLALMLLFPLVLNLGLGASAALQSAMIMKKLEHIISASWLAVLTTRVVPFLVLTGAFTLLYRFLPNTKVRLRPALVGGISGTIGLLLIQKVYLHLQIGVARYNAIYGSFATVPLFLIWIHLGWIVFLSGAEVAYAVQFWAHYRPEGRREVAPAARLALSFDILALALTDFEQRCLTTYQNLADRLHGDEPLIRETAEKLLQAGLLRPVEEEEEDAVLPAAPAAKLKVVEVIRLVWGAHTGDSDGSRLTGRVFRSIEQTFKDSSLAACLLRRENG